MARPIKEGLDYFPLDTNFDEKIQALESVFKNDGLVWIIKFWQAAYRTNSGEVSFEGYQGIIHAENSRVTPERQKEILKLCVEIGLLTKTNNKKYTSNGIKKRIGHIIEERKRWRIEHKLPVIQADNPRDNPQETGESKGKVKESKVNKTKQSFSFEEIYLKYPNRVGKKEALRHFEATVKTEQDFLDIQTALKNYLLSERVKKGFIQNASTWFNDWKSWINIKPKDKEYYPADSFCKVCKGTGKLLNGEGAVVRCSCVKEKV